MKSPLKFLIAFLAVAACSTTDQARNALHTNWIGQSADQFVSRYGLPAGQYEMQNGDKILAWGNKATIHMPGTMTTTGTVSPSGSYTATTYGDTGYDATMACDLQLTVSPEGKIKDINIMRDTWGAWETSRCAEIFD